jgi:hypothetical protein
MAGVEDGHFLQYRRDMPGRPRPGRFLDASRVVVVVSAARGVRTLRAARDGSGAAVTSIAEWCPRGVARVGRVTVDSIGRSANGAGSAITTLAQHLDRRRAS